jgi:septum formation protein
MLILASSSPTRKALLHNAGLVFETHPASINERAIEADVLGKTTNPAVVAQRLAEAKAMAVSSAYPTSLIIGGDQVLEFGGKLLHKPDDLTEAREELMSLRGMTHRLHAGVALARDGTVLWSDVETAEMTMRPFSDAELDEVLAQEGGSIVSSVGGYRLEGPSVRLFERVAGDYFTILGLPLLPLLAAIRQHAPHLLKAAA